VALPETQLTGVLETSLYHSSAEAEAMDRFYAEVLGLAQIAGWGDGRAFRLGAGVVLLFDRDRIAEREEPIAAHGSAGPGHVCFTALEDEYDAWRERLLCAGVEITHEQDWPSGRRSLYFADPAGNLLEIADGDLWPGR
jgi:catechol 2,3-dioxygenase-like lactoylglutathione lyase family enzyme